MDFYLLMNKDLTMAHIKSGIPNDQRHFANTADLSFFAGLKTMWPFDSNKSIFSSS